MGFFKFSKVIIRNIVVTFSRGSTR